MFKGLDGEKIRLVNQGACRTKEASAVSRGKEIDGNLGRGTYDTNAEGFRVWSESDFEVQAATR